MQGMEWPPEKAVRQVKSSVITKGFADQTVLALEDVFTDFMCTHWVWYECVCKFLLHKTKSKVHRTDELLWFTNMGLKQKPDLNYMPAKE